MYDPQLGWAEEEKNRFWQYMDEVILEFIDIEKIIIGEDCRKRENMK